ncbi:MAG: preprotein translocase subunit SecG [Proteobacteria bacterium]|nr:preprotein translocase subunit SecG [Pseudomonadota bacterium]
MNTPLIIIHVIVCVIIIFIVLLQVGRGAEAGAMFGSTGQAHTSRGSATFAGKLTTALAVTFMLTSFLLYYNTSNSAKSSIIDRVSQEQTQQSSEEVPAQKAALPANPSKPTKSSETE